MLSSVRRREGSIGFVRYCVDTRRDGVRNGDREAAIGFYADRTHLLNLGFKLERSDRQLWIWIQVGSRRAFASIGFGD